MIAAVAKRTDGLAPEFAYHLLRAAIELFHKGTYQLGAGDLQQAESQARKTLALESRVLASDEAKAVCIPTESIDQAVQQLASRYDSYPEFLDDLEVNGLDETVLQAALRRELVFDALMQKLAADIPPVSEVDIDLFYQMHRERFSKPELRHARHILITINSEYEQNRPAEARRRLQEVRQQLLDDPGKFADLAIEKSECPTAMQGGVLGPVKPGTLYPELDRALVAMKENEISDIIETEVGLHILLCEKIEPAMDVPLEQARAKIRSALEQRAARQRQKEWLATLEENSDE